jgi:hypothetical protein
MGGGGTGGAPSTTEDLFKCNLPVTCPEMTIWDLTVVGGFACAGELVTSGKPGVLLGTLKPDGGTYEKQSLVIVRGDGTAVLQTRERPDYNGPWESPAVQQQCNVVITSELAAACAAGGSGGGGGSGGNGGFGGGSGSGSDTCGSCCWWPGDGLANCTPIDELSCSDAQAILSQ